jgi:hypothetical protein
MQFFPEIQLAIHDLTEGNPEFVDEYLDVYGELLPQYVRYIPLMRQRAQKPSDESANEKWHQWLLRVQDRPAGMIEFIYNRKRNTGLLLDFGIMPEMRYINYQKHKNLAGLVLHIAMQKLIQDSREHGHNAPLCMITEVEYPRLVEKYAEYGFVEFPVEYFEPPVTPELSALSEMEIFDKIGYKKMYLGAFQIPGYEFDPGNSSIIKEALLSLLEDHYGLPVNHWLMQRMFQEIRE